MKILAHMSLCAHESRDPKDEFLEGELTVGSRGACIYVFGKHCQIVFQKACASLQLYQQSVNNFFQALHSLAPGCPLTSSSDTYTPYISNRSAFVDAMSTTQNVLPPSSSRWNSTRPSSDVTSSVQPYLTPLRCQRPPPLVSHSFLGIILSYTN